MATIVCQGLQSCLEAHLVEPRTLRLKLSAPIAHHLFSPTPMEFGIKSCFSDSNHIKEATEEKCHYEEPYSNKPIDVHDNKPPSKNSDLGGGWSFLQAVSNDSQQSSHKVDKENVYIPPQVYKSSSASKLNEKSLKLCTEDLGCETGSIITENNIFSTDFEAESKGWNVMPREEQQKQSQISSGKKGNVVHNFPPPLTTISSGSDSLQVRPHREDGRLIIKAVKAPITHSCFQAERSDGRLRLCVLKNFAPNFATQEDNEECENEGYENDRNEEEEAEQQEEEVVGENNEEDLVQRRLEGGGDDDEGRGGMSLIDAEEVDGNSLNVGGEEGLDKFERPTRCNEGGERKQGLSNWEPFWVAT